MFKAALSANFPRVNQFVRVFILQWLKPEAVDEWTEPLK